MCRIWIYLLSAVGVFYTPDVYRASAMEVSTSEEVTAVNGTNVLLKCTFKSTHPVSEKTVAISWNFRPLGQTKEETFFHYQEKSFPPTSGLFKDCVEWSGNVLKNDGSITLRNVQFSFNGTYSCQVRNPPDVQGYAGETRLQVVQSVKLSEIGILAAAVGGAIMVVLLILAIFVVVRYCRGRHSETAIELYETNEAKEQSVCALMEDVPLNMSQKTLEMDRLHEEDAEDKSFSKEPIEDLKQDC